MNWWNDLKIRIKLKEPLRNHTTFKIGGSARYFIEPDNLGQLRLLLKYIKKYNLHLLVLGAGSNILAEDRGLNAAVLHLDSPFFKKTSLRNNRIYASSAILLKDLLSLAQRRGLSGLEFLVGIPGTLGGALFMNAGAWKKSIADYIQNVRVMDYNGNIRLIKRKDIKFAYRSANLSKYIILGACLKLIKKDKQEIKNRMNRYFQYRKNTQDFSRSSAGCIFKNPKGESAGRLIDSSGLKGKRIGGASISRIHANFIVNEKNASSEDVLKLMDLARRQVKKKFHINLEPEIKIWK